MTTSFKIKFRPSAIEGKEGSLYFQVIHNRTIRQLCTLYKVSRSEWDADSETVIIPPVASVRTRQLEAISDSLSMDLLRLRETANAMAKERRDYSADDVITAFLRQSVRLSIQDFTQQAINRLRRLGRNGTADGYRSTLNSFMRFRQGEHTLLDDIDSELIQLYEAYLRQQGVSRNTSSFYMRNLRTIYNQAVEQGFTPQRNPFRHVYTGVDKTVKRAVTAALIRRLKNFDLSASPCQAFARDMFMFSFYTRGMPFIDMAYLTDNNLRNGRLSYSRQKTRQQLSIKWEKEMQEIVDRYATLCRPPYLLPIITKEGDKRQQYQRVEHRVNYSLKTISQRLKFPHALTTYVARHSWASIARSKNVSIPIISEGLGHDSEKTTEIYLASIDTAQVDRANRKILSGI